MAICDFSICMCNIYMCVGVVRGGRVFGTLVRELGEKRQKG